MLVHPTNPKAVGGGGTGSKARGVGGDTVDGVRLWMAKLTAALKGSNPAPVVLNTDSQDANQPPARIELTIEGYQPTGYNGTPPASLLLALTAAA